MADTTGSTSSTSSASSVTATDTDTGEAPDRIAQQVAALLEKKDGDSATVIRQLLNDNLDARAKNRELRRALDEARAKAPEGAVILSGADAETWQAVAAAKLTAPDLTARLARATALEAELAGVKAEQAVRDAAEAQGWKRAVLLDLVQAKGLMVEPREVTTGDGDTATTETVWMAVKGEQADPLDVMLADYLPALAEPGATPAPQMRADQSAQQQGQQAQQQTTAPTERGTTGHRRVTHLPQRSGSEPPSQQAALQKIMDEKRATGMYGV